MPRWAAFKKGRYEIFPCSHSSEWKYRSRESRDLAWEYYSTSLFPERRSQNLKPETSIHVCALWNARSICNKTDSIYSYLLANEVTFLAITETWLSEDSLFYVNLAKPCNYNYIGNNRPTRGGDIGIFYLNTFRIKLIEESVSDIWDFLVAELTLTDMNVCIFVLYRCPNSSCSIFLTELVDLVTHYVQQYKWCYIIGDFRIPVNKSCNSSEALLSSIEEMGFYRYSSGPTHVGGNELDLIFFNHRVTNFVALDRTLASDHYWVTLIINSSAVTIAPSNVNLKVKWLWDQADRVSIFNSILTETSAIAKSDFILQSNCPSMIVNSLFNTFHDASVLKRSEIVTVKKKISRDGKPRYYDAECEREKRKKRKLERNVRKHDTPENREAYRAQVAYYRSVLSIKRNDFYTLNFSSKSSKMIFYCLNELMIHKNDTLPVNSSTFDLANRFNIFFKKKVNDIVDELPKTNSSLDCTSNDLVVWCEFASIFPIDLLDVLDDLRTSESPVDIIPTRFLKGFIAENIQFFTDLFNCILLSGVFLMFLNKESSDHF